MNFKISKKKFYDALQVVNHAVSANSPLPSLSGIKMDAKDNVLVLTGSDADLSIQKKLCNDNDPDLGLTILEEGSVVIPSTYLLEIVRKIDSDSISVEIIDGALTRFRGKSTEYKINGMRSGDYPTIDFSKPEIDLNIEASTLIDIIDQTVFATSSKETRPVLTGVNFHAEGSQMECIATDSYRLAKKTVTLEKDAAFNVTIPAKSLKEVSSILINDKEVKIAFNDKKAQFVMKDTILQTRLLDGAYPETERLIPSTFNYTVLLDRDELISAIDRTFFIKTDNMAIVRLQLSSDEIILSNKSQEIGESKDTLHADSYEGKPLDISFSGKYVYDAAKAFQGQSIKIQFTGEMKPFVLTNPVDDSILQLVLPVRTYN